MGLFGKGRHATLGALSCMAASGATSSIARLYIQELCAARISFHAMERIFLGPRSQGQNHYWSEFRGILLHMLQSKRRKCYGNILPLQKRKVGRFCLYKKITSNITLDTSNWNLSMSRTGVAWERWSFDERL